MGGRNNIHCVAVDLAIDANRNAFQSGARGQCDVVVYIDVGAAMDAGVAFYWSDNSVVLTRGLGDVPPPYYFLGVCIWNYELGTWEWSPLQAEVESAID